MKNNRILKASDIVVNQWYNTVIGGNIELCKIKRAYNIGGYNGIALHDWQVVAYYNAKEMFSGSWGECRKWLADKILY